MLFRFIGPLIIAVAVTNNLESRSLIKQIRSLLIKRIKPKPPITCVGLVELIGEIKDSDNIVNQLIDFKENQDISGVLIRIDSGGGAPGSSAILHNELLKIKKIKPVVVTIENSCCSGAYYFACAADYIIASPSSIIGSIGVANAQLFFKESPVFKRDGLKGNIEEEDLSIGKYKSPGGRIIPRKLTDEERNYLKNISIHLYEVFCRTVAESRGLSLEEKEKWADGKQFCGQQALELKLINMLGSISDAKDFLKDLIAKKENREIKNLTLIKIS